MTVEAAYDALLRNGRLAPDPAQVRALSALQEVGDQLRATPPRGLFRRAAPPVRGLYLWGGVGRGKSMLMDLFCASLDGVPRRRVHFHAFMQEVHAAIGAARQRGVSDAIAPVARALAAELRLLCLDEMQIADIADAMIVGRLFQKLLDAGVAIVTTSNRAPDDLYKDGLNRGLFLPFIALLNARLTVHELDAERDYRRDRLAGSPTCFVPADAAARAALDDVWARLTGGAEAAPLTLRVTGRDVTLARFSSGVARVSFWDMCGRPLGAADYLALAAAVRVLILDEVPRLSSSNFNEARRFVTLIDALYEARVRLFLSAADEPERLYLEGDGAFEFVRTASRLREMQAEGWGEV